MGQIVFCYFIQKKGWLGAKKDQKIYQGDINFFRNQFYLIKCNTFFLLSFFLFDKVSYFHEYT